MFLPTVICILLCVLNVGIVEGQPGHHLIKSLKQDYPDFIPSVVIDVGANTAKYSRVVRSLYPNATILMFEASNHHDKVLKEFVTEDTANGGHSEYYISLLTEKDNQTVEYFDLSGSTGNSMFRENTKHFVNMKPIQKQTRSLDSIIAQSPLLKSLQKTLQTNSPPTIDFIKVDVQGAELMVLLGGTAALKQATFVQLEGSTVEYNQGGACLYQMDALLRSFGFYLYDMGDFNINAAFKTKRVGQFDVMYVKPSSLKLPNYLKENNAQFCGVNRHPLDLPGLYDPVESRELMTDDRLISVPKKGNLERDGDDDDEGTSTTETTNSFVFSNDLTEGDWFSGFFSGVLFSILAGFLWIRTTGFGASSRSSNTKSRFVFTPR